MSPTSRCINAVARPKDLRAIHGGHLKVVPSDVHTPLVPERIAGSSHESTFPQTLPAHLDTSRVARFPSASQQTRSFHTSSRVPYDSTSYNVTDVPDFFVKFKQYRTTPSTSLEVPGREHEEVGLMHPLTDSILAGDVVANTRRLKAKIPVEHQAAEGHVVHSSGFVIPGPGHVCPSNFARAKESERDEKKERLAQTAAIARRVLESDLERVDATTIPSLHKVPFEVRERDGIVKHPSGFVPPTPAHKFRHAVNLDVHWERKAYVVRQRARQPSPSRAVLRAVHTASAPKASKAEAV